MIVLGLTGGIASGKTTVAEFFRELGAEVIDADEIARQVVQPGKPAWHKIVENFGQEVLLKDLTIDRHKLGEIVFSNERARRKLNQITHPPIVREIRKKIEALKKNPQRPKVVVIEAALLTQSALLSLVDKILVVSSTPEIQVERLMSQRGLSQREAQARINSQPPAAELLRYAHWTIDSRQSLEEIRKKVQEFYGICEKIVK